MLRSLGIFIAAAALLAAGPSQGQPKDEAAGYPSRLVRIIVSAPAAGGPDIVARLLAERLQKRWGQPVIVEDRPGAGGNLGAGVVAAAEPDGYTLLAAQPAPLTTNVLLYKKLTFDPTALEPVILMTAMPNTLVVRSGLPVNSVKELIDYAKENPGKLNFGSQGIGTTPHLSAELFAVRTGTVLTHVPYRGTADAVNELIAGRLDMLFMQLDAVLEHYRAGELKMLAVMTERRIAALPDVPTIGEAGVADLKSDTWNAIAAPPRTPKAVIAKINSAMNDVLAMPEIRDRLAKLSMQVVGGSPEAMAEFLQAETRRWAEVIRSANITAN
ncbi:MAG: tripartite tricarboxylate transporter substrate binding protein [Xanthobacteraceae bacterium]|jgi:tripartite-type tricarboxylate transporter receptor subunit TctC